MKRYANESCALRWLVVGALAVLALATASSAQSSCPSTYGHTWSPREASPGSIGFGNYLSINAAGDRFVASSSYVHQGLETGAVWVVTGHSAPTQHVTKLLPSILTNNMAFGSAVALDGTGNVLVVGAGGVGPVHIFVYAYDGTSWNEHPIVVTGTPGDWLGASVAISRDGSVFAVGAPHRLEGWNVTSGAIEVFRRQSGAWAHETTLTPVQTGFNHRIGHGIAMSGDGRFVAGRAFVSSNSPVPNGAVYVFERTSGGWMEAAKLQEPVAYSGGGFGLALAFDHTGSVLAAGNFQDSRLAYGQGAVSIFRRMGTAWSFETALLPALPLANTVFGQAVAMNQAGDRLLVGAPGSDFAGVGTGVVEEFEFVDGGWNRAQVHVSPAPQFDAGFGWRSGLACSATAGAWVVGEPRADTQSVDAGQVHVFRAQCLNPLVYCTAQTNTLGCVPAIEAQGTPSVSSTSGFRIAARNVRNRQNGMLLFGTSGRAALPWLGGTLCVAPPLRRTPLVNSGGSPSPANDCSGALVRDFNAWAFASNDPELFAGQHVRAQFYSRDPGAPANVNLSDAVEFYLEP